MTRKPEFEADETRFHDDWAGRVDLSTIDVRQSFEAITAPENRFILELMGPLKGLRLLDVGAGYGESAVYLAMRGADVTMVDLSPRMIEVAHQLAARNGVTITGVVGPAEAVDLPAGTFDIVYAANLIHHVKDRAAFMAHMKRLLRPGGRFYSWDPIAYNPVINVYRRMATEVRTAGETPLTFADFELFREQFVEVRHREFWIAALAIFLKYYLIDRVGPNEDRYWKRILREPPGKLRWLRPLQSLDAILTRLPLVRRLAWNSVVWCRRSDLDPNR